MRSLRLMTADFEQLKPEIDGLVEAGRWLDAIDALADFCARHQHDTAIKLLRDLRVGGFRGSAGPHSLSSPSECPPPAADPFPALKNAIPEIDRTALDIDTLAGAIRHHGALIVRNLLTPASVASVTDGIDRALASYEDQVNKRELPGIWSGSWYNPPNKSLTGDINQDMLFLHAVDAMWTANSPQLTHRLVELFDTLQLKPLLTEYFDDRPCLSFKKWVLRRMRPLSAPSDWHQDGAFMGDKIKSLNLWTALSDCGAGTNCPGVDFVPKRLDKVMQTGGNGATFDWSVSQQSVDEWFADCPPEQPYFAAGDAIFFDHFNLHATSYSPNYTQTRYAIETWFFAQSSYAENQIPIVW